MGTEVSVIPSMGRLVAYTTYAGLAALVGLSIGDLAYTTDREVFYRWSGALWQPVTISSRAGGTAAGGLATDYPIGSLFFNTDTNVLYQQQAGAWVNIVAPAEDAVIDILGANKLDAAGFRAGYNSGNCVNPTYICDDNLTTVSEFSSGNSVTFIFTQPVLIKRYRFAGDVTAIATARFKITIKNVFTDAIIDWVTDIVQTLDNNFGEWIDFPMVLTGQIKIESTIAGFHEGMMRELEIIY